MGNYAIHADTYVLPGRLQKDGYLVIEKSRFRGWVQEAPHDLEIIEYPGCTVAPGFVDTHIHGYADHDVMDLDAEGVNLARQALAKRGTTSWLATTLTASAEDTQKACESVVLANAMQGDDFVGCRTQGIFLEGPFFSLKYKGAQNPAYMVDPDPELFDQWQEASKGLIRKSALAPERDKSAEYIEHVVKSGVVAALGHSAATFDDASRAAAAGASVFVHTYNAMSGLHHREPGMVGAAMTIDGTYAELICDGLHVHPAAAQALIRSKGWEHVVLVSDCLRCGGMPEGEYMLGELPIVMKDGVCRLKDGGAIAGSVICMQQAVQNVYKWGIASAEEAIRMGSEIPARAHNIDDVCGQIAAGRLADFVVLDKDLNLIDTFMDGRRIDVSA